MALEFDPNNPAKQKNRPVWATYIPERRSSARFKQHENRGHALNAMGITSQGCILYHWKNDEWVEVTRIEGPEPDNCERCGDAFEVKDYGYGRPHKTGVYGLWIGKPKLRYVTVCNTCEYDILFPLKKNWSEEDSWYARYNRSAKRKVDDREL